MKVTIRGCVPLARHIATDLRPTGNDATAPGPLPSEMARPSPTGAERRVSRSLAVADPVQLRIPGPTPLPETVREAGARQMVNHRGPEFKELLGRVTAGMKKGFRTEHDVLILTSSGTGALEAAVVNTLSPGDSVLSVSIGVFGDRLAKIARRYGADVTGYNVEQGKAADPAEVGAWLRRMAADGKPAKAVPAEKVTGLAFSLLLSLLTFLS